MSNLALGRCVSMYTIADMLLSAQKVISIWPVLARSLFWTKNWIPAFLSIFFFQKQMGDIIIQYETSVSNKHYSRNDYTCSLYKYINTFD
jgi:hypothetical protein